MAIPILVALGGGVPEGEAIELITSHRYEELLDRILGAYKSYEAGKRMVLVEGTDYGTMALNGGRFWLRGLIEGQYTIKARYLGFEEGAADT